MTNIHIMEASGRLTELKPAIVKAYVTAMQKIRDKIVLPNIDIIFADEETRVIPQTIAGGEARSQNLIVISLNPGNPSFKEQIDDTLTNILAHESHHCARMQAADYGKTLLKSLITEGLADHFSNEIIPDYPRPWTTALRKEDVKRFIKKAEKEYYNKEYNHFAWFFGSKKEKIPRWTGYTLGFELVKRYMEKTGRKASELVGAKAELFIK